VSSPRPTPSTGSTLAALEPVGNQDPGGVDVGAQVDVERDLPHVLGCLLVGPHAHAGVRAEQVDGAEGRGGPIDERGVLLGAAHVAREADRAPRVAGVDLGRDPQRADGVEVGHHDARGALVGEALGERAPDAGGAAGDDADLVRELHGRTLQTCATGYRPYVLATISRWISLVPPYTVETSAWRTMPCMSYSTAWP
jgi:hypothetical protein